MSFKNIKIGVMKSYQFLTRKNRRQRSLYISRWISETKCSFEDREHRLNKELLRGDISS